MAESLNRKIARRYSKAVSNENFRSDGTLFATATVYDSTADLPTSNVTRGAQGYVSSNQRLYIRGTGGWYNIATINNTPSINSVQTAGGDSSPFILATDGATTTVITINATDSEGFPITFSATTDVGFDSIATVSNDSSVFTITPLSEDSAGTATSGTLTFKASDGVNIASEVATFTLVFRITNSNFTNTLLKASGNNGTNVTMSGVTVGGDASTQAFSPYHPGGYSTYFDGTGDYLTFNPGADIAFGTGNFTVEAWVYHTSSLGADAIIDTRGGGTANWVLYRDTSNGGRIQWYNGSSNTYSTGSKKWSRQDKWIHIAYCRSGTTGYFFIDGELLNTQTDSTNYSTSSTETTIGARYSQDTAFFQGYMRDVRIIKGTALYTATFTPPTSARTAITNTKLLACSLPYIADSSGNHTVTTNGNTHTRRFGPYDYSSYNASSHGSSVYFDGTGDKLTASYDAGYSFGTGDFTIEAWIYPTALSSNRLIIDTYASGENGSYQLYWRATGTSLAFYTVGDGVYLQDSSSGNIILNSWNHVAVSRSGTTARLFVNGKIVDTATNSRDMTHDNTLCIGAQNSTSTNYFNGFISDVRIVKGTAVYTAAFTPTTTPLSSISGTSILTCNDAPNVFDGTGQARVKTDGAKSSTSSTKYASASIQTGTSDRVYFYPITSASEFDDLTGDYTIEAWVKLDSSTLDYANIVLYRDESNTSNPHILLRFGNSGFGYHLQFRVTGTGSNNVHSVNLTQTNFSNFRHVALVRNNGIIKLYVDGVLYPTNTGADPSSFPNSQVVNSDSIGAADKFEVGGAFDGNIEDFRFTKNLARYPFLPPSETLTAVTNTVLLTAHAASITGTNNAGDTITVTGFGNAVVSNFAPGSGMKSIYFDGTDDRLEVASIPDLSSGPYTIEGWYYFNGAPNSATHLLWSLNTTNSTGYAQLQTVSGSNFLRLQQRGGQHLTNGNTFEMIANKWYHIATVWDGSNMKVFVNGTVALSSTTNVIQNAGNGLTINGDGGGSLQFAGYISNFRIINGTALYTDSFTPPAAQLQG